MLKWITRVCKFITAVSLAIIAVQAVQRRSRRCRGDRDFE